MASGGATPPRGVPRWERTSGPGDAAGLVAALVAAKPAVTRMRAVRKPVGNTLDAGPARMHVHPAAAARDAGCHPGPDAGRIVCAALDMQLIHGPEAEVIPVDGYQDSTPVAGGQSSFLSKHDGLHDGILISMRLFRPTTHVGL